MSEFAHNRPAVFNLASTVEFEHNDGSLQRIDFSYPTKLCRICGEVYQHPDATSSDPRKWPKAELAKELWWTVHAPLHTEHEYAWLHQHGYAFMPEAAQRLAKYGIVDMRGLIFSPEHEQAYREAE